MTAVSVSLPIDVNGTGLLAARTAASLAGRTYWATDNSTMYRDTGSSWATLFTTAGGGGSTPAAVLAIARLQAYQNLR